MRIRNCIYILLACLFSVPVISHSQNNKDSIGIFAKQVDFLREKIDMNVNLVKKPLIGKNGIGQEYSGTAFIDDIILHKLEIEYNYDIRGKSQFYFHESKVVAVCYQSIFYYVFNGKPYSCLGSTYFFEKEIIVFLIEHREMMNNIKELFFE